MARRWWKASVRKSVTLDKHFISSLTETHTRHTRLTHTHTVSDSSSEMEDKCSFSTPLLRFSILFTTLSSLKEKFIWRHKSHLHQEVVRWLVSDRTAERWSPAWRVNIGFVVDVLYIQSSIL